MKRLSLAVLLATVLASCTDKDEQPNPGDKSPSTQGVSGFVQKGPFVSGSNIIVQVLDEDFNPTGRSFTVTTIDDFGSFNLESEVSGIYVEFIAQGFYFNEVCRQTLSGICRFIYVHRSRPSQLITKLYLTSAQTPSTATRGIKSYS